MNQKTYKRAHLRAPLKSKIICAIDDQVLLGQTMNISEGGILFSKGPKLSQGDEFHLMVDLPDYPNFSNFDTQDYFKVKNIVKNEIYSDKIGLLIARNLSKTYIKNRGTRW